MNSWIRVRQLMRKSSGGLENKVPERIYMEATTRWTIKCDGYFDISNDNEIMRECPHSVLVLILMHYSS